MRLAAKRDKNEREIISTWEAMGAYVESVSGPGLADTLVHYKGRLYRAEVKGAKRGLTKKQVENFTKAWRNEVPTFIVRTTDEAKDMLECPPGTLLYVAILWTPQKGALGGATKKERPFRPGTDKARSIAELCEVDGCVRSQVPGMSVCSSHGAEETFSPPPINGMDVGHPPRVVLSLGDRTIDVTGCTDDEMAEAVARIINSEHWDRKL